MSGSRSETYSSSFVIGGAALVSLVSGLIRTKVAALVLGPSGVGLIGLFQNAVSLSSGIFGLGIGSSATRQVAAGLADTDREKSVAARHALRILSLSLAVAGSTIFYLARHFIAARLLGDPGFAPALGWLSAAVGLTIFAGSQTALLTGHRKIKAVAVTSVVSAILASILAIAGLRFGGTTAAALFVLAVPLAGALVGAVVLNLVLPGLSDHRRPSSRAVVEEGRSMIWLGMGFMLSMLVASGAQLWARTVIAGGAGLAGLGQFQAAWIISMSYMSLILQAMSTDYFPRLSAVIAKGENPSQLVNEQIEAALALAGPILVFVMVFTELTVAILYSSHFAQSAAILKWQIGGDLLKLASWPIGFVLLAQGRSIAFVMAEIAGWAVFLAVSALGLPVLGLEATGIAFLAMYIAYTAVVWVMVRSSVRLMVSRRVVISIAGGLALLALIAAVQRIAPIAAIILGGIAFVAVSAASVSEIRRHIWPLARR